MWTKDFCHLTISSCDRLCGDARHKYHLSRAPSGGAAGRFREFPKGGLCVSLVVAAELRFGVDKLGSDRLRTQVNIASRLFDVLPLSLDVIEHYCSTRLALERAGTPIGANDLFIAAHALALGLPLIIDNIREFSRVPNLRVENWLD
ncbi:MAG: virulence-associated protein VapC-like protein [Devosia sp.]|uniref:PIN domain-containing protein n=1 Tax=Devosia sp. TaxID=1871048 RepID=UPI002606AD5B|nr:PIN domain-containing protein [Devosia sp.]MDB5588145.1 virulence-associated protein VapC-like protein [Devosia sp.]